MNLVLDAVETGHQHRRESEIRIGRRIGEADFDTASLGTGHVRNAQRSRTVASRIGKLHGCFVARHQTLVGVGSRVGEGVQSASVLDDAADVVQSQFGKTGVAVACKEVLILLPDGLVHVHAGTIVTEHGLGHEGGGLTVGSCHVPDRVLHDLQPVGALHERGKACTDFALTGGAHFVMMNFAGNALLFEQRHHFGADVGERVNRRNREIAALERSAMAEVAAFVLDLAGPRTFFGENLEEGVLGFVGERHAVKNEEFRFGTEESFVTDARALEVVFGTAGKRAGIARIALAGIRLKNVASQNESVLFTERIHASRFGIGHQNHVARFNAFPPGHRRAVKGLPVFESVFGKLMGRHGHVLFFAAGVGQTIVNELDIVIFNHLQNVCGRGHDWFLLDSEKVCLLMLAVPFAAQPHKSKIYASFHTPVKRPLRT